MLTVGGRNPLRHRLRPHSGAASRGGPQGMAIRGRLLVLGSDAHAGGRDPSPPLDSGVPAAGPNWPVARDAPCRSAESPRRQNALGWPSWKACASFTSGRNISTRRSTATRTTPFEYLCADGYAHSLTLPRTETRCGAETRVEHACYCWLLVGRITTMPRIPKTTEPLLFYER